VLIRCEKCSTLYELDDRVLPPQGAPVQCSKCQFVFKAYPAAPEPAREAEPPAVAPPPPELDLPRRPQPPPARKGENGATAEPAPVDDLDVPLVPSGRSHVPEAQASALREPPPDEARAAEPETPRRTSYVVREGGALADSGPGTSEAGAGRISFPATRSGSGSHPPRPGTTGAGEQQFTADGRPIRKVPFPMSEPAPPTAGGRLPAPSVTGRRGAGAGPARVIPVVAVVGVIVLVVVALIAWMVLRGRPAPSADAPPARVAPGEGGAVSRPAPPPGTPAPAPGK
jgi:predicted Zn finger-like uncharacterized protein